MSSPHEPVAPTDSFKGKSGIAPIADFVMETDWSVGQILEAIDKAGISDNTMVIFTSDNGHSSYTGWEALIQAGHYPSGSYRGYKGQIWEGGHRVPLIVRWPGHVSAGSRNDQLISLTDIFSTCAELIHHPVPNQAAVDSKSFLPSIFMKKADNMRSDIIHHSGFGEFAIREGYWKLVFIQPEGVENQKPESVKCITELYNLKDDPGEKRDVAAENSEIVKHLTNLLDRQIRDGRSTPGPVQKNDTKISFDRCPKKRWAPSSHECSFINTLVN